MTRLRRNLLRLIIGGVLLAAVLIGVGIYLARSDPRWYRRIEFSTTQLAAGQRRLQDRLATLHNQIGETQPQVERGAVPDGWPTFDIEISEDEINGELMRWSDLPQVREATPGVTEPHIRFLPGAIELAGRSKGSLISIALSVTQTPTGPTVELGRPWAGRLPLSRSVIEDNRTRVIAELREQAGSRVPQAAIDTLDGLLKGDAVRPVVPLSSSFNGTTLLAARVEKLTIEDGVLKATLRPIDPAKK